MTEPSTTAAWLESRLRGSPPELVEEVVRLVEAADAAPGGAAAPTAGAAEASAAGMDVGAVADRLAAAAVCGFEEVLGSEAKNRGSRDGALGLLAADASLTLAFEAAAGRAGDLHALADRLGPRGRLGRLLAEAVRTEEARGEEGGTS